MNIEERKKLGRKAVFVAIIGNIGLTIFNFAVGILSGSAALVAGAADSFSDILTSTIIFIGFIIGLKPPDRLHPYGHGRAEPLVGIIIVVFLGIMVYEIFLGVYQKIFLEGPVTPPETIAAVMALAGVFIKLIMTTYILRIGKKINSPAILAGAHNQKVDIFSYAAIFVGVIGAQFGFPILDPIIAIFISIMVLKTAFDIAKENINNIMGTVPSKDVLENITNSALSVNGAFDVHDVRINYLGPYASVELHVAVAEDLSLKEAHEIAHSVEEKIINDIDIVSMALVHVCPKDEDYCID